MTSQGWVFYNVLTTSPLYPWLMNYLRTDSVTGGSGGTPWEGRGSMLTHARNDLGATVQARLRILDVGSPQNQFYLPEISGCWKGNGSACDNTASDITRYICFITNPLVVSACSASNQYACPPLHYHANGSVVYRNESSFPYECYHLYCAPPGSAAEGTCDPYSNPVPQELVQLRPYVFVVYCVYDM